MLSSPPCSGTCNPLSGSVPKQPVKWRLRWGFINTGRSGIELVERRCNLQGEPVANSTGKDRRKGRGRGESCLSLWNCANESLFEVCAHWPQNSQPKSKIAAIYFSMFILKTVLVGTVFTLVFPHIKLDNILRKQFMIEVIFWGRSPFHFLVWIKFCSLSSQSGKNVQLQVQNDPKRRN